MMSNKKRFFLMASLAMLILAAGGCKKDIETNHKNNHQITVTPGVSGQTMPGATLEGTPEVTPTPTEVPKNTNPFNLSGYQISEEGKVFDSVGNVQLMASLENNLKIGDEFVSGVAVISYDEQYILTEYVSAKTEEDYFNGENCQHHLVLLSADSLKIEKEVVLDGYFYISTNKNSIAYEKYSDSGWTIYTYDYRLNLIAELKTSSDFLAHVTEDGKRCYYIKNKTIYMLNGETNVESEVLGDATYLADYISGIVTDDAGNDFVVFVGMAADYNEYTFILNVGKDEIVRAYKVENGYFDVTKNTYMENYLGDFYTTKWMLGIAEDKAFDFTWTGTAADIYIYTMQNGDKLFQYVADNTMYLFLYDFVSGTLKGSTSFDVQELKSDEYLDEFMGGDVGGMPVYMVDDPIYMDDHTLFLSLSNYGGERFFIKWYVALDEKDANNMIVTEHKMGSLSSVDISKMDNPLYVPGELNEALKPLRTRADKLEERYGIEIYIGEECSNILGGYSVAPLTAYNKVEDSLEMLEEEMGKYPDNFFEQFEYSWVEGLEIYLAGTLKGTQGDVLDYAGGFKTIYNSNIVLVLDCNDQGVESIFHHELCHAIEEKIVDASYYQENPLFHDDTWNSFNPYADMYTYTYAEYGFTKYEEYTYDYQWYNGDVADAYFVDAYAMTYPTEDRARLFESVMTDALYDIDFEGASHLMEKINYYAKCIREVFDTTGWDDVPWEAYSN